MRRPKPILRLDPDCGPAEHDYLYVSKTGDTAWIGLPDGMHLAISHEKGATIVRLWDDPDADSPVRMLEYDPDD